MNIQLVEPTTLSCIRCDKVFEDASGGAQHPSGVSINQPYKGTCFYSKGQYGSTFFDPMNGTWLEINVCDNCLKIAQEKKQILYYISKKQNKLYEGE